MFGKEFDFLGHATANVMSRHSRASRLTRESQAGELSLSQNEYYLKNHLVVDPVADAKFPKFAAAATLERQGKTFYFISEKTHNEFEAKGSGK